VNSEFSLDGVTKLPRVDIVYAHENADGVLVEAAVAAGAKGLVLAGVGDGNTSRSMVDALAAAAKSGVLVVRSSRVGCGIVSRNFEINDDELGFVAALELNPQKARVLLRLALLKTKSPAEVQRMFSEY
jgi:L-asparaginase